MIRSRHVDPAAVRKLGYPSWQRVQRELEKRAGSDLPRSVRESLKQLLDKVASDDAGA